MDQKRKEVRVGLFMLLGIVLLAWMIYTFERITYHRSFYAINATFRFGGGLQKGTPVRVAGYNVGRVRSVEWHSDEQRVKAVLDIDTNYKIKEDARLLVDSEGMLGETYLEFTPGSPEARYLREGVTVKGEVPPTMTEIKVESFAMIQKIGEAVSQVESLAAHIDSIAGDEEFQKNVKKTAQNTAKIAEQAAKSADGVASIADGVNKVIAKVEEVVGKINTASDKLIKQIDERGDQFGSVMGETEGLVKELRKSNQKLDKGLENIAEISSKIAKGNGTIHKLVYEKELYDRANILLKDVDKTAKNMAGLVTQLEKDPSQLMWGKEQVGLPRRLWRFFFGSDRRGPPDAARFEDTGEEQSKVRPGRKPSRKINLMDLSPSEEVQEESEPTIEPDAPKAEEPAPEDQEKTAE